MIVHKSDAHESKIQNNISPGRYKIMSETDMSGNQLQEALGVVHQFIAEVTGKAPTQDEIADALKRYFVLNEIKAHIEMIRSGEMPLKKA